MLRRATFIPASASFHIISFELVDGPIVHTIFVFLLATAASAVPLDSSNSAYARQNQKKRKNGNNAQSNQNALRISHWCDKQAIAGEGFTRVKELSADAVAPNWLASVIFTDLTTKTQELPTGRSFLDNLPLRPREEGQTLRDEASEISALSLLLPLHLRGPDGEIRARMLLISAALAIAAAVVLPWK